MSKQELLAQAAEHYTEAQVLELDHAVDVATKAHEGQKRKSGEPYIIHPLAVGGILVEWGMDIDTVLAGVLHDTIEDTSLTLDTIESYFGRDVAFLVDGVTKVSRARSGMRDLTSYLPAVKTCVLSSSSWPTACTTCVPSNTNHPTSKRRSLAKPWKSLRHWPTG